MRPQMLSTVLDAVSLHVKQHSVCLCHANDCMHPQVMLQMLQLLCQFSSHCNAMSPEQSL